MSSRKKKPAKQQRPTISTVISPDLDPIVAENFDATRALMKRLQDLTQHVARELTTTNLMLDLNSPSIHLFEDMKSSIANSMDYVNNVLEKRTELRRDILSKYNYTLVSLGGDSLPTTLSAKYGLIGSNTDGRLTCPFDLSVHPVKATCELLKTNFAAYGDKGLYEVRGETMPFIKSLGINFTHDQKQEYIENSFEGMIAENLRRVENFHTYCSQENLIFLLHTKRGDLPFLKDLEDILGSLYPKAKLLILHTEIHDVTPPKLKMASFYHIRIPSADYMWQNKQQFLTREGLSFENDLITTIADTIKSL